MEYNLNIFGEFKNREIEETFLTREVMRGLTLIKYMVLFSGIANFLFGILDYLYLSYSKATIQFDFAVRTIVLVLAIVIFIYVKKAKPHMVVYITCGFAFFIYGSHFLVASNFVPLNIMFETFSLILLSTCLFLMPNRWIINLCLSLVFFGLYLALIPAMSVKFEPEEQVITMAFVCWNFIVIGVLFYRINLYKRQHFAKEIQLEELANTDHLTKINNR